MLNHFLARVAEKSKDVAAAPVLIVALGDSVTQGCMEHEVIDQEGAYPHRVWQGLTQRFPACSFSMINAGVAGDNVPGGLKRLERDVLRHGPDLVLVGYCLNDSCGGDEKLSDYKKGISEIVTRIRQGSMADLILLTPNFMCTRPSHHVAAPHRAAGFIDILMKVQNGGTLARFAQGLRDVARELNVPLGDAFARWEELAARGVDTTAMLSNGLNHPTPEAHRIPAEAILQIIDDAAKSPSAG